MLFCLAAARREHNIHEMLEDLDVAVPVATCARGSLSGAGPADAIWLVHGASDAPRRLIDLAALASPLMEQ